MADLGEFVATAYGPPWVGIQGTGTTATGRKLARGDYVVAVDPKVIPLHTRLQLSDNPFHDARIVFTALDTGGAIKGRRIDVFDWRGRRTQLAFGKRAVRVHSVGPKVASGRPVAIPRVCPVSISGYVRGKNGPVNTGIWELERLVGVRHVHDDWAPFGKGHAQPTRRVPFGSYHYCGLAVDLDALYEIWAMIFPWRELCLELFGPWGLYHRDRQFHDPPLQQAHNNHIHVALNLASSVVARRVQLTGLPTAKPPAPPPSETLPGVPTPAPKVKPHYKDAWKRLMHHYDTVWPASARRVRAYGDQAMRAVRSGK